MTAIRTVARTGPLLAVLGLSTVAAPWLRAGSRPLRWTDLVEALALLPQRTPRERQILALVAEGLDNPTIARRLVINPLTVRNHLTNIPARLGVPGRRAATEVAHKVGMTKPRVPPPR